MSIINSRPAITWRSPLRGPWLTAALGTLLLGALGLIALTGFVSHGAYHPGLPGNATLNPADDLPLLIHLPASWPSWDYALSQGTHVTLGLMTVPLLLAKLWSVMPRLFGSPVIGSLAGALERLSIALLVGSGLAEFATGILEVQGWYPFHFDWYRAHYYGAWLFTTMFVLHALIKLPAVRAARRARGALAPLRDDLAHTRPEPPDPSGLAPLHPAPPTLSRRGLLAIVGGASATILAVQAGESIGGPFRRLSLLAPGGRPAGTGPTDFPVTNTAASAGILAADTGPGWRLTVVAARTLQFTREELLAMPQASRELTIACTDGWSSTQRWTGVPLAELARLTGAPAGAIVTAHSIERVGSLRVASLAHDQYADGRTLLALGVNGAELSLDHGYPARVIAPGVPGVHNTKWVRELRFEAA